MAIYDCFSFCWENDLLELRLNQHWDYVDKFIIVEAGETHTGQPKSFNFDVKRFKKFQSKIIYHQIKNFNEEIQKDGNQLLDHYSLHDRSRAGQFTDDWIRDHFQGNYPIKILKELGAADTDIVYLSALDEILSSRAFEEGAEIFSKDDNLYPLKSGDNFIHYENGDPLLARPSFGFNLDMYVYKFNLFCKNIAVAQMTQFSLLKKILPATIRSFSMHTHKNIENAGWHFTFLDDTDGERVFSKHKSWAHSRDHLPGQKVKFTHESKEESLKRLFLDYEVEKVDITEQTHPKYLIDNLDKYKNYILDKEIDLK